MRPVGCPASGRVSGVRSSVQCPLCCALARRGACAHRGRSDSCPQHSRNGTAAGAARCRSRAATGSARRLGGRWSSAAGRVQPAPPGPGNQAAQPLAQLGTGQGHRRGGHGRGCPPQCPQRTPPSGRPATSRQCGPQREPRPSGRTATADSGHELGRRVQAVRSRRMLHRWRRSGTRSTDRCCPWGTVGCRGYEHAEGTAGEDEVGSGLAAMVTTQREGEARPR
jgi:hypothetical protein